MSVITISPSGQNISVSTSGTNGVVTLTQFSDTSSVVTVNQGQQGPAGVSIHYVKNAGNDRILTSDGSLSGLYAESDLTFDGSKLRVGGTEVSLSGHSHSYTDISGFNEGVDDRISGLFVAGTGIIFNYNDAGNSFTISVSGVSFSGHTHQASDIIDFSSTVSGLLPSISGSGYVVSIFDNNIYTLSVTGLQPTGNYSLVGHTHKTSDITDFNDSVSGLLSPILNSGNNRILTSTGSSFGINAENNLTFDGYNLVVNSGITSSTGNFTISLSGSLLNIDNIQINDNIISSINNNSSIIIQPSGYGAIQRDSGGDTRGDYAIDWQGSRALDSEVAAGKYSVIGGGNFNKTQDDYTTIAGGTNNVASGIYSFVGGGASNKSRGSAVTISAGESNTADGDWSTIGGGSNNQTNGDYSAIVGGAYNTVSGMYGIVVGGYNNNITAGYYSAILGGQNNNNDYYNNVFILGSNIIATQHNTTYTENLISQSGRFTNLTINNTGVSLSGHIHVPSEIIGISGYVNSGVGIYFSGLSTINNNCNIEYFIVQDSSNTTRLVNITGVAESISVIDGGGVIYDGCP